MTNLSNGLRWVVSTLLNWITTFGAIEHRWEPLLARVCVPLHLPPDTFICRDRWVSLLPCSPGEWPKRWDRWHFGQADKHLSLQHVNP